MNAFFIASRCKKESVDEYEENLKWDLEVMDAQDRIKAGFKDDGKLKELN